MKMTMGNQFVHRTAIDCDSHLLSLSLIYNNSYNSSIEKKKKKTKSVCLYKLSNCEFIVIVCLFVFFVNIRVILSIIVFISFNGYER